MQVRVLGLGARLAVLVTFAVFFVGPILWLLLAPTKSDAGLITHSPFSFGDLHHISLAWKHLDAFSSHIFRRWIGNTLYYAFSATAITLAVGVPAGYGLAIGTFPGRRLVLFLTLLVMIVPGAALVLPIFLELNAMHLIGSVLSVILPFSFVPFGVYLAYLYPITVGLWDLLSATPSFNPAVGGGGQSVKIFKPELALATLIAVVPVAIVFVFSQRALVRGLVGGAVKE
jgi:multiple sugar transport system permease protein